MMKYDSTRGEILDGIISDQAYQAGDELAKKRKMFGTETWFLNGYMFAGAGQTGVFVHLGESATQAAVETNDMIGVFSPRDGMVMKNYALILPPHCDDRSVLTPWLEKSAAYLANLPRKEPKKRRKT